MKLCTIDSSLNEKIPAKQIANLIDSKIANVKIKILRPNILASALSRKNLERSHILLISLPRKRLTAELASELASYIDIGGSLILTLPDPAEWGKLGWWFEVFREELGISFAEEPVYGLPKVNEDTRLVGTNLTVSRAFHIFTDNDPEVMRKNGVKEYIPLAYVDDKPVAIAAYKRRGVFVIFSSEEVFEQSNSVFINRLLYILSKRINIKLDPKAPKYQIASTSYYVLLQHAVFDTYLISLYHHDFEFHRSVINNISIEFLADYIERFISLHKSVDTNPTKSEILTTTKKIVQKKLE